MTASTLAEAVTGWSPEPIEMTRTIDAAAVEEFAALIDSPPPGPRLPPLWHWFGFGEVVASADLGSDGHPQGGRFLPPIEHRRRMWGGGRFRTMAPMAVGDAITRRSAVTSVALKQGSTGELVVVTERHDYLRSGVVVATDEFDIVYRSVAVATDPGEVVLSADRPRGSVTAESDDRMRFVADPPLLFRFSALTRNAHRIHYDAAFAIGVEGHRDVVVHGPLLVLLAMELPRRFAPGWTVRNASFVVRRPVFVAESVWFAFESEEVVAATVDDRGTVLNGTLEMA